MRVRLRPKFAQAVAAAIDDHVSRRGDVRCLEGNGTVETIADLVGRFLQEQDLPLLFRRLPDVGNYRAVEVIGAAEVPALIAEEFANETSEGVSLLEASGDGGLVLHFDERTPAAHRGRVSLLAWGRVDPLLDQLADRLFDLVRYVDRSSKDGEGSHAGNP